MAMGRPVLASAAAFEGVRAVAGRDLLVASDAPAFADAALAILRGQHNDIGGNARLAMVANYAWDATLAKLDPFVEGRPGG
jgi:hypothetical protein